MDQSDLVKRAKRVPLIALLLGSFLLLAQAASADVNDELKKIKEHADCVNRCQRDSFACMAGCSDGQPGASCRANCLLASTNCSQNCP